MRSELQTQVGKKKILLTWPMKSLTLLTLLPTTVRAYIGWSNCEFPSRFKIRFPCFDNVGKYVKIRPNAKFLRYVQHYFEQGGGLRLLVPFKKFCIFKTSSSSGKKRSFRDGLDWRPNRGFIMKIPIVFAVPVSRTRWSYYCNEVKYNPWHCLMGDTGGTRTHDIGVFSGIKIFSVVHQLCINENSNVNFTERSTKSNWKNI